MDKPLRVLVVGVPWPMETFLDRLLCGLAEQGIQITLASDQQPPASWLQATFIHWLPAPMWRGLNAGTLMRLGKNTFRSLIFAMADARTLWSQITQGRSWAARLRYWYLLAPFAGKRLDLIYFPWNSHAINYLPLFALGIPVVLSCRGSQVNVAPHNPRRGDLREGLRVTLEKATRVHCVSQDILQEAQAWGLDPSRARVIYPAVDPDYFKPLTQHGVSQGSFRLVTTGSLIWRKGLEYALLAIRQLKEAGIPVHFEIIGDGPERSRVLYTIQDLDLQQQVTLSGKLPPEMVRLRLQQADAFLLASLSEGISNAVLEAMACRLPVVTSDCGGMREAVTDGVEGFVTPVRDPSAMAVALSCLYQEPDLRQRMGQAGRQKVLQQHNLDAQISAFINMFQEAVTHG